MQFAHKEQHPISNFSPSSHHRTANLDGFKTTVQGPVDAANAFVDASSSYST